MRGFDYLSEGRPETYAEALWFLMTRTYDPDRQAFAVTCYMDSSGTDDQQLEHAVLGGVVFNKSGFTGFDEHWTDLMHRYGIQQPFHMKELNPHGALAHITGCRRWCLLADVMAAINYFKIYTLVATMNNRSHSRELSQRMQAAMRVYRLTFMGAAIANHKHAVSQNYQKPIAYLLDSGTKHVGQVIETARLMQCDRDEGGWHVGTVAFESDTYVTALQAADVVAWLKRRLDSGEHLPADFEPLLALFAENHMEAQMTDQALIDLNARLDKYLTEDEWPKERPAGLDD